MNRLLKLPGSYAKRVLWLFSVFAAGIALMYSAFTFLIAFVVEDEVLARVMALEAGHVQQQYAATQHVPDARVDYLKVYVGMEALPEFIARRLAQKPNAEEVFTEGRDHFHILRFDLADDVEAIMIADATELLSVSYMSGGVTVALIALLLLCLIVALLLARRLARYTVTPITRLSEDIQAHQQGPIALKQVTGGEEISALARQFESTYNQLDRALQREAQFTRDISHELRTPLTTLANLITLSKERDWQPKDFEVLKQATAHMQDTVSVLLALARKDSMQDEVLGVRALVERAIIERVDSLSRVDLQVELSISSSLKLTANRHLLVLLVGNLIENAMAHGSGETLHVAWQDNKLSFRNAFDGEQPQNPQLPEQKGAHSEGLGLGLFLVTRICEALNWQPEVHSHGGWFDVTLTPPVAVIKD